MALSAREIRRRIKSVKNTKQIMKTMEMVASTKMRHAQTLALKTRPFAEKAYEILSSFQGGNDELASLHPFFLEREVKHVTAIVVSSDRGLCGGFNSNIIRKAEELTESFDNISYVSVGAKARDAMLYAGKKIEADFSGIRKNAFYEALPLMEMVFKNYLEGKTDKVIIVYTHFVNTMLQKPVAKTLIPLLPSNLIEILKDILGETASSEKTVEKDFSLEPSPKVVFDSLLVRLLEMQVYEALLESEASEHSARMVAMKNAKEAAGDLIDSLTLTYNQQRQSAITTEISEIVNAAESIK